MTGLSLVRWYGGKGLLAPWIINSLPAGYAVYVEPFGGAASVMLNKPPHPCEVYNDLHGDLVNLFRCVQDEERFLRLQKRLEWTLYSREEFRDALTILNTSEDKDERAWAFFVAQNQGFSGQAKSEGNWGRVFVSSRGMATTASKWQSHIESLEAIRKRMMRVQIDNVDALQCIRYWDKPETLFYLDPPYVHSTRTSNGDYTHEMTDSQHEELVSVLLNLKGGAVLSGYDSDLYRPLIDAGWVTIRRDVACAAAGRIRGSGMQGKGSAGKRVPRTEVLYVRANHRNGLFEEVE